MNKQPRCGHKRLSREAEIAQVIEELPTAVRRQMPRYDPALDSCFVEFFSTGDQTAFNRLFDFFLPLVTREALIQKIRRAFYAGQRLDDLISDGCVGLLKAFQQANRGGPSFYYFAGILIRKAMFRGTCERLGPSWRLVRRRKAAQLNNARAKLVMELGRTPTPEETRVELSKIVGDRAIQIGDSPRMLPLADCDHSLQEDAMRPLDYAIGNDVIEFARKTLEPRDREIFNALLEGHRPADVARKFKLSRCQIDALLWHLRTRADLANELDRAPMFKPKHYATYGRNHASSGRDRGGLPPQLVVRGIMKRPPLAKLERARRTDAELLALLNQGYSQRALLEATRGNWKRVRARISATQTSLLSRMRLAG